jgi:hypothetical protein
MIRHVSAHCFDPGIAKQTFRTFAYDWIAAQAHFSRLIQAEIGEFASPFQIFPHYHVFDSIPTDSVINQQVDAS